MKTYLFVFSCLLFSQVIMAEPAWRAERVEIIPAPTSSPDLIQFPLQIIVDQKSAWAQNNALKSELAKTSAIFRTCGLEIGKVTVQYAKFDSKELLLIKQRAEKHPELGLAEVGLVTDELKNIKPVAILLGKELGETAKAFNQKTIDVYASTMKGEEKKLLNLTVLAESHLNNSKVPNSDASYSNLAHELAHLLGNFGHIPEDDNLMSDGKKSGKLNENQCQLILQNLSNVMINNSKSESDCR